MVDEPELSGVHRTAVGAAVVRGLHLLRDGDPKILRDVYAIPLAGKTGEGVLGGLSGAGPLSSGGAPFSTATWVTRSRFAEDRLAEATARGVYQYVILGAGLDSFALRQADALGEVIVYEVDDPPMQAWKRMRIEQLGLAVPSTLRFVPCDFETSAIPEVLLDAGFVSDAPAVVSWLGVTQYLTSEAIVETLRWAGQLAPGSEIVLTFVQPGPEANAERESMAARGTRFETFFTPEDMVGLLGEARLRAELITPEQLNDMYFANRDDGMRAATGERLVVGVID